METTQYMGNVTGDSMKPYSGLNPVINASESLKQNLTPYSLREVTW